MMACVYGAAFGAIQQMPRIVPGLRGSARAARARRSRQTVSRVQYFQEIGGLAGRILLAFLAVRILSRRRLLHVFQIPGHDPAADPLLHGADQQRRRLVKWGICWRSAC